MKDALFVVENGRHRLSYLSRASSILSGDFARHLSKGRRIARVVDECDMFANF